MRKAGAPKKPKKVGVSFDPVGTAIVSLPSLDGMASTSTHVAPTSFPAGQLPPDDARIMTAREHWGGGRYHYDRLPAAEWASNNQTTAPAASASASAIVVPGTLSLVVTVPTAGKMIPPARVGFVTSKEIEPTSEIGISDYMSTLVRATEGGGGGSGGVTRMTLEYDSKHIELLSPSGEPLTPEWQNGGTRTQLVAALNAAFHAPFDAASGAGGGIGTAMPLPLIELIATYRCGLLDDCMFACGGFGRKYAEPPTPEEWQQMQARKNDAVDTKTSTGKWSKVKDTAARVVTGEGPSYGWAMQSPRNNNSNQQVRWPFHYSRRAVMFDASRCTFHDIPSLGIARAGAASGVLSDGRVYIAGGTDGLTLHRCMEAYDPRTMKWSLITSGGGISSAFRSSTAAGAGATGKGPIPSPVVMSVGRAYAGSCTSDGGRKLIVAGGCSDVFPRPHNTRDCQYDTAPPCGCTPEYVWDVTIAAARAVTSRNASACPHRSVEAYSIATRQWHALPDLNYARMNAAACSLFGSVYVIGGNSTYDTNGPPQPKYPATALTAADTMEILDWETDGSGSGSGGGGGGGGDATPHWRVVQLPTALLHATAAVVDHELWLIGGSTTGFASAYVASNRVYAYDPRRVRTVDATDKTIALPWRDAWATVDPLAVPRRQHSVGVSRDGTVYAFGGVATDPSTGVERVELVDSMEYFGAVCGTWRTVHALPARFASDSNRYGSVYGGRSCVALVAE